jgi:uncharacterized protein (TIGR03437 family)
MTRLLIAILILAAAAAAQPSRIERAIDSRQRHTLAGNLHPKARAENDQGRVLPSRQLSYVTLALAQSETQQAELDKLLTDQQTPSTSNYHRWLTPEDFAQRFGVSEDDLNKIRAWLEGQGLTIAAVARGRNWIAVNGTAAQFESALQTQIHTYLVNGQTHFANATEPSVPAAFAGVVRSIRGLNDFRAKPAKRPSRNLVPDYTSASSGRHYLAPDDLATIYNMASLYKAGIDGSGQSLVIAGQTQIALSDIQLFRSSYNLPAIDPQIILVPNSKDPGISSDDLPEADLDIEWAGAVARNANVIYVYSDDVMQSVQYAIDQNLAPVVSTSYGLCELETPVSDALTLRSWAKQGNAQGITWFSASGDSGGADCNDVQNSGYSVDAPASIPEVTGVGGTAFQEGSGTFWNAANDANRASVLSYIPEVAWNDSAIDGEPSATGGGASFFFAQPSWQTGPGVPADNARHVPDISMTASADHDGYLVYTSGILQVYGGTSVPTPAFAGVAALLNQYLVSSGAQSSPGLGNMNPKLYSLAQSTPDIFHDIVNGDNIVTVNCPARNKNCGAMPVGFSAGVGYDSVTGLGSVDTYRLVTGWNGAGSGAPLAKTSIKLLSNLNTLSPTDVVYLIATASNTSGVTPSGSVQFQANGASLGSANLAGLAGTATATLSVSGSQLPQGSPVITAVYTDSSANSLSASVTVSVTNVSAGSALPAIDGFANGASFKLTYAPGMTLSIFGSQLATSIAAASSVPLPISMGGVAITVNGVVAPLYYISPGQLNIQIPYETAANSTATVNINNNGHVTTRTFNLASAAPGIFVDQNSAPVPSTAIARGKIGTLFITGAGSVTPPVSTGAAPSSGTPLANLPKPTQDVSVTVGGVQAPTQFVGIPYGLVGVTQINYQVPTGIGIGTQPVVVKVGSVSSAPASLNVTN